MTAQAVFLVINRHLLVGRVRLVERPSPSISPQRIASIASFFVFDHDEPHLCSRGPMCVPSCQLRVIASEDLFYQHGSISKLSILAVILGRARRRVREMHLNITAEISDGKNS